MKTPEITHLARRAGFGYAAPEMTRYRGMSYEDVVDSLVDYEGVPDAVDAKIGDPAFASVTPADQFLPGSTIAHARQRWLFRMVHTERPLQEKMALFWHNLFATGYSKVAGALGTAEGTRVLASVPAEDPAGVKGQYELLREHATGSFRDLLVAMAKDVAMLVWLDGRSNVRTRPQENFARELLELFTSGIGTYTEADVYAAARVFTGWNMVRVGTPPDPAAHYEFQYNPSQHDTAAKTFTFAVYSDGGRTIPARASSDGMQDGLDLLDAVARRSETALRLARRLCGFFLSETSEPPAALVQALAATYLKDGTQLKPVLRDLFNSSEFRDSRYHFARYSWPYEFVVRAIRHTGWKGFPLNEASSPLSAMGQQIYDPPNVGGWNTGAAWFSSGTMLARMNFAATITRNQKAAWAAAVRPRSMDVAGVLEYLVDRLDAPETILDNAGQYQMYLDAGGAWTGNAAQWAVKAPGLAHLVLGSPEYQFV